MLIHKIKPLTSTVSKYHNNDVSSTRLRGMDSTNTILFRPYVAQISCDWFCSYPSQSTLLFSSVFKVLWAKTAWLSSFVYFQSLKQSLIYKPCSTFFRCCLPCITGMGLKCPYPLSLKVLIVVEKHVLRLMNLAIWKLRTPSNLNLFFKSHT